MADDFQARQFNPDDFMELFDPEAVDSRFFTEFMSTWCSSNDGHSPDEMSTVAVPLTFQAQIVCMDGLPVGGRAPKNKRVVQYEKKLKIPAGALCKVKDAHFTSHLMRSVFEKQKSAMVQKGSKKCGCCGRYADGFVTDGGVQVPQGKEQLATRGLLLEVRMAVPACQETDCNRRIRQYMTDSLHGGEDLHRAMCANCGQVEGTAGKFKVCSRCHMRYYCSRECQREDWKEHKKMCR